MRFSASIEYAIHGLVYLAGIKAEKTTMISDVAEAIKVPESYLRKVFQLLSHRDIVISQRGVKGGYRLAREPELISIKDVVEAIDGSLPIYSCLKSSRGCRLADPCPVRETFDRAREKMADELARVSLKDVLHDISRKPQKLSWLPLNCN